MHHIRLISSVATASALTMVLAGCGHSTPESATPTDHAAATGQAAPAYTPTIGAFAVVPAAQLQQQKQDKVASCNLDAINGKPATSAPVLPHTGTTTFTGWAADVEAGSVPSEIKLVLQGTSDYVVAVPTGMSRQDVATANNNPALANAGYSVAANLSRVQAGQYKVVLLFDAGSKHLRCETDKKVSIQ